MDRLNPVSVNNSGKQNISFHKLLPSKARLHTGLQSALELMINLENYEYVLSGEEDTISLKVNFFKWRVAVSQTHTFCRLLLSL